jgi:hypothetical protein
VANRLRGHESDGIPDAGRPGACLQRFVVRPRADDEESQPTLILAPQQRDRVDQGLDAFRRAQLPN